ncbi:MAG: uracil-DNA glycosylase [Proteobacteria bacterium]|nr:uracil-DNA glycosylase [Pseudomonadota bacterium]
MTNQQHEMLASMGIDVWIQRTPAAPINPLVKVTNLAELARSVAKCMRCELHEHRIQTVFGTGAADASWLIIGEAPGAEEDRCGEPFVGRAGQLLTAMLRSIGLAREQVFIANVLKCRPPNNRDPKEHEVAQCAEYLSEQVRLIQPRIILAVGRIAAQSLLKTATPIGKMRGQRYTYGEQQIPVVVTYHPAYLLRSPQEKRKSWQDLNFAKKLFEESCA